MFSPRESMPADSTACVPWIESAVKNSSSKARLLLWVDAVGGFFVCHGSEVRFGQAVPEGSVDVPLLADLSRHHATIRRDEDGYTIEPVRDVWLNGRKIDATSWITDGSLLQFGSALTMRFSRPHPLSSTARLDFVSHHTTQPSTRAILLMADACVLGPGAHSHVVCRHWPHDVVLYRQHGGLYCRCEGTFEVDGKTFEKQAPLTLHSHVSGEEFSFGLEEI